MSLAIRAIVKKYRSTLSARPDGKTHVKDIRGVTHVTSTNEYERQETDCGIHVQCDLELSIMTFRGNEIVIPTWDIVDCVTCLARRSP